MYVQGMWVTVMGKETTHLPRGGEAQTLLNSYQFVESWGTLWYIQQLCEVDVSKGNNPSCWSEVRVPFMISERESSVKRFV